MEVDLRIIKTPSGEDLSYDFSLWDDRKSRPAVGQRVVEMTRYENFSHAIRYLQEHVATFKSKLVLDTQVANEDYRYSVGRWLTDVARMVKREFLPAADTAFGVRMAVLERRAKAGQKISLRISTNEYLIPWWLANSYDSDNPEEGWTSLFAIGFFPAHFPPEIRSPSPVKKPRIALISRPSSDLRNAADINVKLIEKDLDHKVKQIDGQKNASSKELGRFGLLRDEIEQILKQHRVLLYYGHFDLNENYPEKSYLEALQDYAVGRKEREIPPEKIQLSSIENLLKGKVLFLDACRSSGLPFLGDHPFPRNDQVLPDFYLRNKIVCIGTIYPIFDDAAVEYMTSFLQFFLSGYCIGDAMREARNYSRQVGYELFDWASYILVGDPRVRLKLE